MRSKKEPDIKQRKAEALNRLSEALVRAHTMGTSKKMVSPGNLLTV